MNIDDQSLMSLWNLHVGVVPYIQNSPLCQWARWTLHNKGSIHKVYDRGWKKPLNASWLYSRFGGLNIQVQFWPQCALWTVKGAEMQALACPQGEQSAPPNEYWDGLSHCKSWHTQWILMLASPLTWGNIHGCFSAQRHPKESESNMICS